MQKSWKMNPPNSIKILSERFTKDKDVFLSFVKENGEYITQIERAYYGVITDAIEGCFAFNINPQEYGLKTDLAEKCKLF